MKYLALVLTLLLGFALGWYLKQSPAPVLSPSPIASPLPSPLATENPPDPNGYVRLAVPIEGQTVQSPLVIRGEAKGTYYFEGSFPVILTDWDGRIIAESFATAQDEWMTEDYVPFEATLEFETPAYGERGALILQRDNPSGLPEHDDAYEITVNFASPNGTDQTDP